MEKSFIYAPNAASNSLDGSIPSADTSTVLDTRANMVLLDLISNTLDSLESRFASNLDNLQSIIQHLDYDLTVYYTDHGSSHSTLGECSQDSEGHSLAWGTREGPPECPVSAIIARTRDWKEMLQTHLDDQQSSGDVEHRSDSNNCWKLLILELEMIKTRLLSGTTPPIKHILLDLYEWGPVRATADGLYPPLSGLRSTEFPKSDEDNPVEGPISRLASAQANSSLSSLSPEAGQSGQQTPSTFANKIYQACDQEYDTLNSLSKNGFQDFHQALFLALRYNQMRQTMTPARPWKWPSEAARDIYWYNDNPPICDEGPLYQHCEDRSVLKRLGNLFASRRKTNNILRKRSTKIWGHGSYNISDEEHTLELFEPILTTQISTQTSDLTLELARVGWFRRNGSLPKLACQRRPLPRKRSSMIWGHGSHNIGCCPFELMKLSGSAQADRQQGVPHLGTQ